MKGSVVSVNFRDGNLKSTVRQYRIDGHIDISTEILKIASELLEIINKKKWAWCSPLYIVSLNNVVKMEN